MTLPLSILRFPDSSTLLSNVSEQLSSASEALLNPNRDGLSVLTDLLAQNRKQSPPFLRLRSVFPSIRSTRSKITDRQCHTFYSTLAMWVGGVVLAAMLKVNVSGKALTGVFNPKPHETYIGRSLLFIAIGLLQSSLICLGDLFYLNIQCQHPVLLPFRRMVYKHRVCKYHLCAHRFIRRYRKSRLRRLTCYAGSRKRRNIPY